VENGLKSVSFPSISTGAYSYPIDKAAKVAIDAVVDFLKSDDSLHEVRFVLFDDSTYKAYEHALQDIAA
jgi:O-acetyl-ADP-ribose deacetylase (regulator of RNase III)